MNAFDFEIIKEPIVKKLIRKKRIQSTVTKVTKVEEPLIKGATCSESTVQKLVDWINEGINIRHSRTYYSFNIAVKDEEGNVTFHPRTHQPCWGELRTHYKDIRKPSDLHHPFPKGTPVAIALWNEMDQEQLAWMLSAESPWTSVNGRCGVQYVYKGNEVKGIILRDMDIDPTVLGQMLLVLKPGSWLKHWKNLVAKGANPNAAFLITWMTSGYGQCDWSNAPNDYAMVAKVNLKRFFGRNPRQITVDANTFTERGAYNRKNVHDVFNDEESTTLRKLYKDKYPVLDEKSMLEICEDLVKNYSN